MKIFNTLSKLNFRDIQLDKIEIFPRGKNLFEIDYNQMATAYFTTDNEHVILSFFVPNYSFEPNILFDILIKEYELRLIYLPQLVSYMGTDLTMENAENISISLRDKSMESTKYALASLIKHKAIQEKEEKFKFECGLPPYDKITKVYSVINQVLLETLLKDSNLKIREMGDLLFGMSLTNDKQNLLVFNRNFGLANIIIVSELDEEYALLEYLIKEYNITLIEYQDMMKHQSECYQMAKPETALFQMGRTVHCKTDKILEEIYEHKTPKIDKNNLADTYDDLPF